MPRSVLRILAFVFTICFFTVPFVSAADVSYSYDANGNLINGDRFSYIYDDGNHLTEVRLASDNSLIAQYFYDDAGNRIKKVSGGITTYYIGNHLESRVSGAQKNDTSYYFANNERVARKDPDGSKYYYHGDHLGSTSIVTNASGGVVESVAYLPYGETQSKTGSGSTYLYTDQELDSESGLYYYDARYYSPEIMRFVEPDTIIQDLYNPQNLNRYSYVMNNPVRYSDPSGHIIPILLAGLIVGGVVAEYMFASSHPIDRTNPNDLVNIWIEGGKGMVVASVEYFSGLGAAKYLGAAKAGVYGLLGKGMISGFSGQVTENALSGATTVEELAKGTPEATAAGAFTEYASSKPPLKTVGRLPEKASSMLIPTGKNAQRIWGQAILGEGTHQLLDSFSSSLTRNNDVEQTQMVPQEQPENQYCTANPEKPIWPPAQGMFGGGS